MTVRGFLIKHVGNRGSSFKRVLIEKGRLARNYGHLIQRSERGQGTTEYAILVGVLVVIAIIAVMAFRGKLQSLWDAISSGINGL